MLLAMITRFAATLEIKRRRLVASAVAGVFLLIAMIFAVSAGWLWLAGMVGAIGANLICAAILAVTGGIILLVGRPRRAAPIAAAPVASTSLVGEIMAAFVAGSQLGRTMRR